MNNPDILAAWLFAIAMFCAGWIARARLARTPAQVETPIRAVDWTTMRRSPHKTSRSRSRVVRGHITVHANLSRPRQPERIDSPNTPVTEEVSAAS